MQAQVEQLALNQGLASVIDLAAEVNRYLEQTAPRTLAKAGETSRVATVLYTAAEALRLCALLLSPVMPERMATLWQQLGWQAPGQVADGLRGVRCSQERRSAGASRFFRGWGRPGRLSGRRRPGRGAKAPDFQEILHRDDRRDAAGRPAGTTLRVLPGDLLPNALCRKDYKTVNAPSSPTVESGPIQILNSPGSTV